MALPTTGPLGLQAIQTEFGGVNPIGLNEYYAGGGLVPAGTSGTNGAVPSSGAISIQSFYGSQMIYASGGTVTASGGYTIHTFNTSGTFTINGSGKTIEVLIVAGGSGGNPNSGLDSWQGGGGAGGLLTRSSVITQGAYGVVIGAAGTRANGGNSTFDGMTAFGGGSSRSYTSGVGGSGGCGGGSGTPNSYEGSPGSASVQTSNGGGVGRGFGGGAGAAINNTGAWGGGGGGCGGAGGNASDYTNGTGGPAYLSSISGTSVGYARGGDNSSQAAPRANLGDGGFNTGSGGVVIIRYLT
jgi:hypothetical protein